MSNNMLLKHLYIPYTLLSSFRFLTIPLQHRERGMSNDQEDERRLHLCLNKYKKIVEQFDELIEMMSSRVKPPKRGRSCGGSSSAKQPASSSQPDSNEAFVQTISRFLQELRADSTTHPVDASTGTRKQE